MEFCKEVFVWRGFEMNASSVLVILNEKLAVKRSMETSKLNEEGIKQNLASMIERSTRMD